MFSRVRDVSFASKKYLLVYLVLTTFLFLTRIGKDNILNPKSEIIIFCLVIVLGIFCMIFYFMNKSDKDLHKVAFVVILCFGVMSSLVVPISDVSDEWEHFARAEITSQGVIFPHWTGDDLGIRSEWLNGSYVNGAGFVTIESTHFFWNNLEKTVLETPGDTDKINYAPTIIPSAFEQNPFWGYIPQAIGIFLAKLLDLNVIWMLWLGRICNLLFYAGIVSMAIKKTPYLKIPLMVVACMPITLYQAASINIDSMIFALSILAIAYFIFMSQAGRDSLNQKHIISFSLLCLILGLCKLPYLTFVFLLLFVPRENFKNEHSLRLILICILCLSCAGLLWSHYSQPALLHSWRARNPNINPGLQIEYILAHPFTIFAFFKQIFSGDIVFILQGWFRFFTAAHRPHYPLEYEFISLLVEIFLAFVLLAYPSGKKFDLKTKAGALFVILVIYVGTCVIQLLTWSNVGQMKLGISLRYFIPLFALIPLIFDFNMISDKQAKFNHYSILFVVCFASAMILSFIAKYY